MRFSITDLITGGVLLVRPEGDVDITTAAVLRERLLEAVRVRPARPVICDLEGVGFLDSVGIAAMVAAHHDANDRSRPFLLAAPRGHVRRALELVRLVDTLPCFATVTEAMAALSGDGAPAASGEGYAR